MSAYRDDLEALEARRTALAAELTVRWRELRAVDRLLAEARASAQRQASAERSGGLDVGASRAARHRRRVGVVRTAAVLAGLGAMLAIGSGMRAAGERAVTTQGEGATDAARHAEHERATRMWSQPGRETTGVGSAAPVRPPR